MKAQDYVSRVIKRVAKADRSVWRAMDQEGVASYRYLAYLVEGRYKDPGIFKLEKIDAYLQKQAKAA